MANDRTHDLMEEVARAARERTARDESEADPRWRAMVHGELTPDQAAALDAEAKFSAKQAVASEVFSPLGGDFKARVLAQAKSSLDAYPDAQEPVPVVAEIRRPSVRRLWPIAAGIFLAMALLHLLQEPPPSTLDSVALDGFHVEVRGRSVHRSGSDPGSVPTDGAPILVGPGSALRVQVTPQDALRVPVDVALFLRRDREVRPIDVPASMITREPWGTVLIQGPVDDLRLPLGDWRLITVVASPGHLPSATELMVTSADTGGRSWRRFEHTVQFLEE